MGVGGESYRRREMVKENIMDKLLEGKLVKADWWRLNKRIQNKKVATETIEWTHQYGGYVRAKLDSISPWSYQKCSEAKYAVSLGNRLIYRQKKGR